MRNSARFFILFLSLFCLVNRVVAQDFYGTGVQEVRVELPYKNWDTRLDSIKKVNPEARLTGYATVNGIRYDSVGVRYKGNSSYFRSRNDTYKKLPINVRLDYKNKNQKLRDGHTTLKFSNAFLDPGFIREPLSYEIIRKYMPAPLCNFSKVYMNSKYYGLYINSEAIDANFIKKTYGTTAGFLVKCDPDNWQRVRSQPGCPKGENASLSYLNDNSGCYDAFYEIDNPAGWKYLLNLIKVLNKTPEKIETVLDVDQTLWMLALNNVLVNLDSYNGSLSHNYYLWFDTTGVAHPLIWDLNMSFGGWRRNFSFEEMKDLDLIQYQPLAESENIKRPLINRLLKNPTYRKIYLAHMRTIVNEELKSGQLLSRAQSMSRDIDAFVKQDTMKLYSYLNFQNALEKTMKSGPDNVIGVKQLMSARGEWLQKHPLLTKVQPVLTEAKHTDSAGKMICTVHITNGKSGWLYYRKDKMFAFKRTPLFDDGTNGDATAGDGIFTASVDAPLVKHYYFAAENDDSAATFPARASYEFLKTE